MERVHTRRSKKSQYAVTAPLPSKPGSSSSGSEGSGSTQAAAPALPPWEKVLWRRQPYPDNYTDASFLQHLVVNADVPTRDYWRVVLDSAAINQQLAVVVVAVAVPLHLRSGLLTVHTLLITDAALLLLGYAICGMLGGHVLGGSLLRGVRQAALLSGGVYLMCPLLHSLTANISADSVIATTAGLCVLHLALHDYNFVNSVTEQLTGTLSLGAAVFAALLSASALPSEQHVFAHVLLCLQLFLLSPFARRYVRTASASAHISLTVMLVAAAVTLLAPLSRAAAAAYITAALGVSFWCPAALVRIQKFKAKINGPWDEAAPRMPTGLNAAVAGGSGLGSSRPLAAAGGGSASASAPADA